MAKKKAAATQKDETELDDLVESAGDEDSGEETEKPEKPVVDIIRGRMPVAIAALIKFHSDKDDKDADLAAKYRTTNGKISDLRQNRNFAYVTADFKPDAAMVEAANAYADQLEDADGVKAAIAELGEATKEEAEAFAQSRKSTRKTTGKPKKEKAEDVEEPVEEDDDSEASDNLDDLLED